MDWNLDVVKMKGFSTVVLTMGAVVCKVEYTHPLLIKNTQNPMVKHERTPPLLTYEHAQEQPQTVNTDSEQDRPPSVLLHTINLVGNIQ